MIYIINSLLLIFSSLSVLVAPKKRKQAEVMEGILETMEGGQVEDD